MHCLKCGKKTTENQQFCDSCLTGMNDYPIKLDAKVHLPHRPKASSPKQPRKRALQPEEQLVLMHRLVRRLIVALIVVTVLFILSAAGLVHSYKNNDEAPTIGRNYTVGAGRNP